MRLPWKKEAQVLRLEPSRSVPIEVLPPKKRSEFGPASNKSRTKRHLPGLKRRSYEVADMDNCIGWDARDITPDGAIFQNMDRIRARCRDLARNNDYARLFLSRLVNNVVGPHGIKFQARSKMVSGKNIGNLDKAFNAAIEDLYKAAGKKKNKPTVDGKLSRKGIEALWIRSLAVDGEVIVRHHEGTKKNKFRYGLEFIDPARLDWMKNESHSNGNQIRMGVEVDQENMPVAYWILENHPQDHLIGGTPRFRHARIEAKHITHSFALETPGQTRGVSMLASAGLRAHLIDQFEKAIVVGGIVAARKVGFYKMNQELAEEYGVLGNEVDGEYSEDINDESSLVQELTPGMFEQLPSYVDGIETFDPKYPPANFEEFEKRMLRGMASGFGDQYHAMANDLEGVNYTSSRTGELAQRDVWRGLQQFLTDEFCDPQFSRWAEIQLLNNQISIDKTKLSRLVDLETYVFVPRGWSWVDPLKEMKAHELALDLCLTTRRKIIAETDGRELEDVADELLEEEDYLASLFEKRKEREAKEAEAPNPEEEDPEEEEDS